MIAPLPAYDDFLDDEGVQLMLQLQQGDLMALEELMELYAPLVSSIVRNLVGPEAPDEDIQQEVFFRVFRSRFSYVPSAKFCTWLALITKNYSLNLLRTKTRRPAMVLDFSDANFGFEKDNLRSERQPSPPDNAAIRDETATALHDAVTRLRPRQRTAVQLFYFQGLSYHEASERMNTSPHAVKSLLARARLRLRSLLPEVCEDVVN